MTASQVFHVPFEEVTSLQRSNAKAVNFGIIYGKGSFTLAQDLEITRKEAEEYINAYFARYPKIKGFMEDTIKKWCGKRLCCYPVEPQTCHARTAEQ